MMFQDDLTLRSARSEEHELLTDLCIRSKAIWGYDEQFMEHCRAELTLGETACTSPDVGVAERLGEVLGIAGLGGSGRTETAKLIFGADKKKSGTLILNGNNSSTGIDFSYLWTTLDGNILNEENIEFDTDALEIIARSGQGSLRDTLTMLDQAIIFSKGRVTTTAVVDMLGLIDPDDLEVSFRLRDFVSVVFLVIRI